MQVAFDNLQKARHRRPIDRRAIADAEKQVLRVTARHLCTQLTNHTIQVDVWLSRLLDNDHRLSINQIASGSRNDLRHLIIDADDEQFRLWVESLQHTDSVQSLLIRLKIYCKAWMQLGVEPDLGLIDGTGERDMAALARQHLQEVADRLSESGGDSVASDSGVGSHVSQASLPTTTPPASPGYLLHPAGEGRPVAITNITTNNKAFDFNAQRNNAVDVLSKSNTPPSKIKNATAHLAQLRAAEQSHQRFNELNASFASDYRDAELLTRSRSHESNLMQRIMPTTPTAARSANDTLGVSNNLSKMNAMSSWLKQRGSADYAHRPSHQTASFTAAHSSTSLSSQLPRSPSGSIQPPKSPRSLRLLHSIPHAWVKSRKMALYKKCDHCKQSLAFRSWEKCSSCKAKVHTDCKSKIGDGTCGLTKELLHEILRNPQGWENTNADKEQAQFNFDDFNSTGSSSTPSTPAAMIGSRKPPAFFGTQSLVPDRPSIDNVFEQQVDSPIEIVVSNVTSDESDLTGSQNSQQTIQLANVGSITDSQHTLMRRPNSASDTHDIYSDDEVPVQQHHRISRNSWSAQTIKTSTGAWSDFTIKFEEINFRRLIGNGLFGEVHKGYWHQEVAVKLLRMDHVEGQDQRRQQEAFKEEVASFKNTRHENIVLFLGYCMVPPKLGIVMNYCRGRSLHHTIHSYPTRFDLSHIINIALQITQGMSYLHGRSILHKDLRTKNIFIEPNNKVIITDFGLFSIGRLYNLPDNRRRRRAHYLHVPECWLSYLAPELMRSIFDVTNLDDATLNSRALELPFSLQSDVYAFGTVWYELLTGEVPYAKRSAESIVWMVGRGLRPPLSKLTSVPKEVRDLLVDCWTFDTVKRKDFFTLYTILNSMPSKHLRQLQRSPSNPVVQSRSVESLF